MRLVVQRVQHASCTVDGKVTGKIGTDMKIELLNDGPFTILLDSDEMFGKS